MSDMEQTIKDNDPLLDKDINRRDFLTWIIKGGMFTTLSAMLLPALTYLWPVTRQGPAGGLQEVASENEIPVWGSKKVIVGGSAILIIRTAKEYKAFSAICTHLGCLVTWDDQKREILCPCHAGIFDTDGRVVTGPPPRPLPFYQVKVSDGKIFVKV